jgi:hypothetical protein
MVTNTIFRIQEQSSFTGRYWRYYFSAVGEPPATCSCANSSVSRRRRFDSAQRLPRERRFALLVVSAIQKVVQIAILIEEAPAQAARRPRSCQRRHRAQHANYYNNVTALVIFYLKRAIVSLVLACVVVYAADFGWIEYRVASGTDAFGSIQVERYYAVKEKDGKTEFMFDNPSKETCVNSIFPHWGHTPCWYLSRHTRKRVNL